MCSWLNKMWEEGLLDQDMLTEDDTTIKDKIHNGKCGISYTSMGQLNILEQGRGSSWQRGHMDWYSIPDSR